MTQAFFSGAFCKHWSMESCNMLDRWAAERGEGVEAGKRPDMFLRGQGSMSETPLWHMCGRLH